MSLGWHEQAVVSLGYEQAGSSAAWMEFLLWFPGGSSQVASRTWWSEPAGGARVGPDSRDMQGLLTLPQCLLQSALWQRLSAQHPGMA